MNGPINTPPIPSKTNWKRRALKAEKEVARLLKDNQDLRFFLKDADKRLREAGLC